MRLSSNYCLSNIESKDSSGRTPLLWAAIYGHEAIVRLLLEEDADFELKDKYGQTPLSRAAEHGHEAIIELLLAKDGVSPNTKDTVGRTPLLYAAMKGYDTIVMALLTHISIDPDPKDHYGSTPLSVAAANRRTEVVKLLLATGRVNSDSRDSFGRTPLWWARSRGSTDIVQILLDNAEKRGISVSRNNLSSKVDLTSNDEVNRWCDICTLSIQGKLYYYCRVCNGGDFDICWECFKIGGRCLEDARKLIQRKDKGDFN